LQMPEIGRDVQEHEALPVLAPIQHSPTQTCHMRRRIHVRSQASHKPRRHVRRRIHVI
jgi:hypothetical protein